MRAKQVKIAIVEDAADNHIAGFDKVIGFPKDTAINIADYVTNSDILNFKGKVGSALEQWLNAHNAEPLCAYRGVDILQVYGVRIFDFLSNVSQKVYIVRKIIEAESPSEIYVADYDCQENSRKPCLNYFLSAFIPSGVELKRFKGRAEHHEHNVYKTNIADGYRFHPLNILRFIGNLINKNKGGAVIIDSDTDKIPLLLSHLKGEHVIFLREEVPEKLLFHILLNGATLRLYSDFNKPLNKKGASERADGIIEKLQLCNEPLTIESLDYTQAVKKYLTAIWRQELPLVIERIDQAYRIFERSDARSILLDEDKSIEKNILAQISSKFGCDSYVNCHGEPFQSIGYLPLSAHTLLVWGRLQKKEFVDWGLEQKRIKILGCTKYDKYFDIPDKLLKAKVCKELGLNPSKTLVLLAPIPIEKGGDLIEKTLWDLNVSIIKATLGSKDVELIVKLHPSDESAKDLSRLAESLPDNTIRVVTDYDSLALTKGCDILVASDTTFAIDGLAYKKPVILTGELSIKKYKGIDYFYEGDDVDRLKDSLRKILNGADKRHIKGWREAVDICLNGMDGLASKRLASILTDGAEPQNNA